MEAIYNLMIGANYLDINCLVQLCAKYIANSIRGKTAEEMREILGIVCDLTQKEIKEIELDHKSLSDFNKLCLFPNQSVPELS